MSGQLEFTVIPAQAGTQVHDVRLDSRLRGNNGRGAAWDSYPKPLRGQVLRGNNFVQGRPQVFDGLDALAK